jgi:hypothetical protein
LASLGVSLDGRSSSRGDSGLELRHCASKDTLSGLRLSPRLQVCIRTATNDLAKDQKVMMDLMGQLAKNSLEGPMKQNQNSDGGSNNGEGSHSRTTMQSHPHLYTKSPRPTMPQFLGNDVVGPLMQVDQDEPCGPPVSTRCQRHVPCRYVLCGTTSLKTYGSAGKLCPQNFFLCTRNVRSPARDNFVIC